MISVLHLDLGAGPELSLGGLALMRRPAHRPGLAAPVWAHPYTGLTGMAVFYNDGGTPPAPTPADVAARAGQQTPTPAVGDDDEKVTFTQRRFNVLMKSEKDEGRRAAYRQIAEAAGLDPDTFDPTKFGDMIKQAEQARQAQLTEEQRRTEELTQREQELQARIDAAAQRETDAARRDRESRIRAALVSRGATGDDLEDAARLISVADDATDEQIEQAATELKERRGVLFGAAVVSQPGLMPPAPGGAPAGGPPPRQAPAGRPGDRGREMARLRGHKREAA